MTEDVERDRIINQLVNKIWKDFDTDNSGMLDKPETRRFLMVILKDLPPPNNYVEEKFEQTYEAIDKNGDGFIEKFEMNLFIKSLVHSE